MPFPSTLLDEICQDSGMGYAALAANASPLLRELTISRQLRETTLPTASSCHGHDFLDHFRRLAGPEGIRLFIYSGEIERLNNFMLLAALQYVLSDHGWVLLDNADFPSVYNGIREILMSCPGYKLREIVLDRSTEARAGQGVAVLCYRRESQNPQDPVTIPESKNKSLHDGFRLASPLHDRAHAEALACRAVARWTPGDETAAQRAWEILDNEFPDHESPQTYWHDAYKAGFTDFFSWGHDQDFGFGLRRKGTMARRHEEILAECLEYGYIEDDLTGLEVLDVGCWTGGDVLALAGLGAQVTALEEHPVSARAAARLCSVLDVPAQVHNQSLYREMPSWRGRFDLVYLSGVIYHVSDPLLALRICFAYLKPGGRIIVETKASHLDGAYCEYSGTMEKGWNWYAPTLETLGRWLVDVGFKAEGVSLHVRPMGRLLARAFKTDLAPLPDKAGFSRPGSWLEENL